MNVKRMLELADHLDKMPKRAFAMDTFGDRRNTARAVTATVANRCGTTCCIAGEKILLDGGSVRYAKGSNWDNFFDAKGQPIERPDSYAMEKLGLSEFEAEDLFYDLSLDSPKEAAAKIRRMVEVSE